MTVNSGLLRDNTLRQDTEYHYKSPSQGPEVGAVRCWGRGLTLLTLTEVYNGLQEIFRFNGDQLLVTIFIHGLTHVSVQTTTSTVYTTSPVNLLLLLLNMSLLFFNRQSPQSRLLPEYRGFFSVKIVGSRTKVRLQ